MIPAHRLSRRNFLSSSAAVAAGSAWFWNAETRAQMPMPAAGPSDEKLDGYVAAYMKAMNAPGLTLAVTDVERPLRTAGYGFANLDRHEAVTTDHLFQIGSITKSFVALVLLQLRDEGKLDLHKPVLDYLPGLPILTEFGPVSVHHLLTHTSGLPDNLLLFAADPAARLVQGFKPGEHFHYCNAGFDILGYLAAKLDGRPWRICVAERILKPLAMNQTKGVITTADRALYATGYEQFWDDQVYPRQGRLAPAPNLVMDDAAGCIASTPGDMGRYARMLLARGRTATGRIVSEESFVLMTTPFIKAEELGPTASYGYGIAVDTLDGHKILRHTGGMVSFASSLHVDLDGGVAAFASINAMQGYRPTAVTEYAVRLARAQRESKPLPPAPAIPDPIDTENAAEFAGTFTAAEAKALEFVAEGKRLTLRAEGKTIPLQHAGGDVFLSTEPGVFATYPIVFGRKKAEGEEKQKVSPPVVEVSYGPDWFVGTKYEGERKFAFPKEYAAYAGHYRCDGAWGGSTRVFVSKGRLTADGTALSPIGGALFRVGEEDWSPLTAEFLHVFEGKARLLRLAGTDFFRVEVE